MDIFAIESKPTNPDITKIYMPDGTYIGYVCAPKNGSALFTAMAEFQGGKRRACGAFPTVQHAQAALIRKYEEEPEFCSAKHHRATRRVTAYRKLQTALVKFYADEVLPRAKHPDASTAGFLACWVTLGGYLPRKFRDLVAEAANDRK